MSNINIQQFNGSSYQELLPKSQAYNWGYEGQMPQLVKYTNEEFDALLETEWQKMPFTSAKQVEWKKEAGRTFFGTLWRYNQESGVLTGITYESSERWYRYRTSNGWGQFYSMAKKDSDYLKANSPIQTANLNGYIYPLYTYSFSPQSSFPHSHNFKEDGSLVFNKPLQYVFENIRAVGMVGTTNSYEIKRTPVQTITTKGTILNLSRQRYLVVTNKSLGSLTLNQEIVLADESNTFTINQLWTDTNYSWTIYTSNGINAVLASSGRTSFIYYSHTSYNMVSNGTQYIIRPTQPSSTNLFINESQQYGTAKPILSAIYN